MPRLRPAPVCHVLVGAALLALVACSSPRSVDPEVPRARPRLAVLVVFDQMRGDYPSRWRSLFGEGGFARLAEEGAWFQDCHYPYGNTFTAPGHATCATGCSPDVHGIVANEWYDIKAGEEVLCVGA